MKTIKNKEAILKELDSLVQLDVDAVFAYEEAIENIDIATVKSRMTSFKEDHERHIVDLSKIIKNLGGTPPERSKDAKGYLIEGFTKIRSATGTAGALKAMRGNELLTNLTYEKALSWDLPSEIRQVVEKNRNDEAKHIAYIQKAIDEKIWEGKASRAA